ncbi:MAG TPA: Arc family DNA-binding protein [Gemmatimonadales bacterium]|nr:Arc family DNA-binding protein [Gemmatimonadales bacterium]
MPTLTIKGLPEPIYRQLKAQAETNRRSLNGEIIACLERSVGAAPFDAVDWLADVEAFRERSGVQPVPDEELRAARRLGRA